MPELPEVETIRRQLEPNLQGRTIVDVSVPDRLIIAPATLKEFVKDIIGKKLISVGRRGKYLLLQLESGQVLVLHLRMTGRLTQVTEPISSVDRRHLRLILKLDDGNTVVFHDMRRFGKAFILAAEHATAYWQRLGPEPLDRSFNKARLKQILKARNRPIKSLLLDQQLIAGIGNIYADESLARAGINPLRSADSLNDEEIKRLAGAIKLTLRRAILLEGSSIDTYRTTRGNKGRFQETFRVHRRGGEPCHSCGSLIKKIKVGGRGTYFCPHCQK